MWLIIRISDNAMVGTNLTEPPTVSSEFVVKEWLGVEPAIHDPFSGIESYDPTLAESSYPDFLQRRVDFDDLHSQASTEIGWLNDNIPLVASADLATLRQFLERVMREQRQEIKAWRYIFSRFA